jgi:predicted PurR-regulated permease PerM
MRAASGYCSITSIARWVASQTAIVTIFMVTVFLYFLLRHGKEWVADLLSIRHSMTGPPTISSMPFESP